MTLARKASCPAWAICGLGYQNVIDWISWFLPHSSVLTKSVITNVYLYTVTLPCMHKSCCYQQSFSEDLGPSTPNGRIQAEYVDGVRQDSFIEERGVTRSAR
jgi:hypothetical protein